MEVFAPTNDSFASDGDHGRSEAWLGPGRSFNSHLHLLVLFVNTTPLLGQALSHVGVLPRRISACWAWYSMLLSSLRNDRVDYCTVRRALLEADDL